MTIHVTKMAVIRNIIIIKVFLLLFHNTHGWIVSLTSLKPVLSCKNVGNCIAFHNVIPCRTITTKLNAEIGIFYGTSTGNTMDCAEKIYKAFGEDIAAEPVDIDSIDSETLVDMFQEHTSLIVGTPTWNTGADTQRSGTGWDEIYYTKLPAMKDVLLNKNVAVFGLGDQSSYSSNFADATGELYDVFTNAGCNMIDASWSTDGYNHDDSKSIRNGKFCGLILDMINQEELTDERVTQWVNQLKMNGILGDKQQQITTKSDTNDNDIVDDTASSVIVNVIANDTTEIPLSIESSSGSGLLVSSIDTISTMSIQDIEQRLVQLQNEMTVLQITLAEKIQVESSSYNRLDNYIPHYNPVTQKTMWISPDGRSSYFTSQANP